MKKILTYVLCIGFCFLMTGRFTSISSSAEEEILSAASKVYSLDESDKYVFENKEVSSDEEPLGTLSLSGDINLNSDLKNGFISYSGNSEQQTEISYLFDKDKLNVDETEWHIKNDNRKSINGIQLDSKIESGALIVQTSFDGSDWTTDSIYTNVFSDNTVLNDPIYATKDIQLQNGCYYRVIVAYQLEKRVEDGKILFVTTKNYEKKNIAEVYDFYIIDNDSESSSVRFDTEPRYEFGEKINTGKDNGYSGNEAIDNKDPHMGWDIGKFVVNGYTQQTRSGGGDVIFLKTVGDEVTLWFRLLQDIDCLNDNDKTVIAEDKNGYDVNMGVEQTNFGRGTLIIKHTDYQNKVNKPVIYTNYLEANTGTGAETRVKLNEEGNYEVSLDYEIKSGIKITNYKINFKFQIRNGNCMVFPKDNVTGKELSDFEITENGFFLDMARSRYLKINVTRSVISEKDGMIKLDQRFDRPANETDVYTDDGIYTFTVTNEYTNRTMTKTIYVGKNQKLYRLLKKNNNSVNEINQKLEAGYTIGEYGDLIEPVIETEPPVTESEVTEVLSSEREIVSETSIVTSVTAVSEVSEETTEYSREEEYVDALSETELNDAKGTAAAPIIVSGAAVLAAAVFVVLKLKK